MTTAIARSGSRTVLDRTANPPSGQEVAWAKINHMIAEQAPGIPFHWDKAALVQSQDVLGVASAYSAYITTHDLTFASLKR